MNTLERKSFEISVANDSSDLFFFAPINGDEISSIMVSKSKLYPIHFLASKSEFLLHGDVLLSADQAVNKLTYWVCDSQENSIENISTPPLPRRQKLIR